MRTDEAIAVMDLHSDLRAEIDRLAAEVATTEGALKLCSGRSLTIERERDRLTAEVARLVALLEHRDAFIVRHDLWFEYTDTIHCEQADMSRQTNTGTAIGQSKEATND